LKYKIRLTLETDCTKL